MNVEGYLTKSAGGLAIAVNSDRTLVRQRFTIAHELGHVILSRYEGKPIEQKCRALHYSDEEELLVDMIAAEILMPSEEISTLVPSLPKGWKAIEYLVWNYRVSYTAAIRRLLNIDRVLGVWITGSQTTSDSFRAWCSDPICGISDCHEVWKTFCWEPVEGASHWLQLVIRDDFGRLRRDRLRASLKFMGTMRARCTSKLPPNNCWILAWTERDRPKVQLTFDFAFGL